MLYDNPDVDWAVCVCVCVCVFLSIFRQGPTGAGNIIHRGNHSNPLWVTTTKYNSVVNRYLIQETARVSNECVSVVWLAGTYHPP